MTPCLKTEIHFPRPIIFWYPPKTNMTMENQQFEDLSPIKDGDVPMSCQFSGVYLCWVARVDIFPLNNSHIFLPVVVQVCRSSDHVLFFIFFWTSLSKGSTSSWRLNKHFGYFTPLLKLKAKARWWFQIFFSFHPYLGRWSNLIQYD